jgi:hypothetical protein
MASRARDLQILKNDLGVKESYQHGQKTGNAGRVDRNQRRGVEVVSARAGRSTSTG